MAGVTDVPVPPRYPLLLRNALWWLLLFMFYAAAFRPLMASLNSFPLHGGLRLLLVLGFHVLYGIAGYFAVLGPQWLRQSLVFGALLANGLLLELLVSGSYMYSHLAGMFLFGVFSAIGVGIGRLFNRGWTWCRTRLEPGNGRQ